MSDGLTTSNSRSGLSHGSSTFQKIRDWQWIILSVIAVVLLGICAGLIYQAFLVVREEAKKMRDSDRLRDIARALLSYEQVEKSFPPAYTVDQAGNKLHSWRTLILPHTDNKKVYQQIDFSKPWDAPENAQARSHNIETYLAEGLPSGDTLYRAIIDPRGIFTGPIPTKKTSITDDRQSTMLIVQAGTNQATHWMKPDEYSVEDFLKINDANATYSGGRTHILRADGAIKVIDLSSFGSQNIEAMITISGGETIVQP